MPSLAWERLGDYLHETQLLGSVQNTLYWDQNTMMPLEGAAWRGEQLTLLARYLHARQTSPQLEDLIKEAKVELKQDKVSGDFDNQLLHERAKNIELLDRDLTREKRLDPELVAKIATAKSHGYSLWQEARFKSDFKSIEARNSFFPSSPHIISCFRLLSL